MKREARLISAYWGNVYGLADLPWKISGVAIARIIIGEESGCSRCFPHGYETINCTMRLRNWKAYRKTQWKPRDD